MGCSAVLQGVHCQGLLSNTGAALRGHNREKHNIRVICKYSKTCSGGFTRQCIFRKCLSLEMCLMRVFTVCSHTSHLLNLHCAYLHLPSAGPNVESHFLKNVAWCCWSSELRVMFRTYPTSWSCSHRKAKPCINLWQKNVEGIMALER